MIKLGAMTIWTKSAVLLAMALTWSLASAAPPMPDDGIGLEPRPGDTIGQKMVIVGENYVDLIDNLEEILSDFEDFYREVGQASLSEGGKAVKDLRQSIAGDYSAASRDRMLKKMDILLAKMEALRTTADSGGSRLQRRQLRQLRSFESDLEDLRDELDAEYSDNELKGMLDDKTLNRIIRESMRNAQQALRIAQGRLRDESLLIVIPPFDTVLPAPHPPAVPAPPAIPRKMLRDLQTPDQDLGDALTQTANATVGSRTLPIDLHNAIGAVLVQTWNRSEVQAVLTINYSEDSHSSTDFAKGVRLLMETTPQTISVSVIYPEKGGKAINVVSSKLEVSLPSGNPVAIENAFGPATIADLQNDLKISSSFGSVDVQRIKGDVTIANTSGAVYTEAITGRLTISNSFGDIETVAADGVIELSNSYAPVTIRNASGELRITNSGPVTVHSFRGDVDIRSSNGDVEVETITGNLVLANSFGSVRIESVTGDATIENANASVEITDIGGQLRASNKFASIQIENVKKSVRAESSNGVITVDNVGGEVLVTNRFGEVAIQTAGGPVQVDNSNAEVTVSGILGDVTVVDQFGPVNLSEIKGNVDVRNQNASIDLVDIGGATTVRTTFGLISGENLDGPFMIDNANGSVELSRLGNITKNCEIRVTMGDISLELPPSGGFNVIASTSSGDIDSDLPMTISTSAGISSGQYSLGATYPTLLLKGQNTSIRISIRK